MTFANTKYIEKSGVGKKRGEASISWPKNDNMDKGSRSAGDWAQLVSAIAETGDHHAFKTLYNYFAPRVKSFMLKSGLSEGAAEEISQETLLTVWRKAGQYKPSMAAVSTWIFTIARNKKIDKFRKDSRPLPDANDPTYGPQEEASPEQSTFQAMDADRLYEVMSELPEEQKQVLVMSFIHENPQSEISTKLGLPLGTVKSRIRLGLGRLRHLMDEENRV